MCWFDEHTCKVVSEGDIEPVFEVVVDQVVDSMVVVLCVSVGVGVFVCVCSGDGVK